MHTIARSRVLSEQGLTQIYASKSACVHIRMLISVNVHLSFDPDLRGHSLQVAGIHQVKLDD